MWQRRGLIRGHHKNGREIFSSTIIQFSLFLLLCNFCILKKGIKSDCNDLRNKPSHTETTSRSDKWISAKIFSNCFASSPSPYEKREETLNRYSKILHRRGSNFLVPLWFNLLVDEVLGLIQLLNIMD